MPGAADLSCAPGTLRQAGVVVTWQRGVGRGRASGDRVLGALVADLLGVPREQVRVGRLCPRCGSDRHGRPLARVAGGAPHPWVSLSRAGDLLALAVSGCGPVGVDVEDLAAARFDAVAEVALHPRETARSARALATTWVRKESLLKATGDGLALDPRGVRLSEPDSPPSMLEWPGPDPPVVWMRDLDLEGHACCVSVLTGGEPELSVRPAGPAGPAPGARPGTGPPGRGRSAARRTP